MVQGRLLVKEFLKKGDWLLVVVGGSSGLDGEKGDWLLGVVGVLGDLREEKKIFLHFSF